MSYSERLTTPWWWWPVAAGIVAVLGTELRIDTPLIDIGSYVAIGVVTTVLIAGMGRSRLTVEDGALRAGPAVIPVGKLGAIRQLRGEALRYRLGPGADPAAFLLVRSWVPGALELLVVDPDDDTPYWLVSTRHPDQLMAAIQQSRPVALS